MSRLCLSSLFIIVIFGGVSGCGDHSPALSPLAPDNRLIAFSSDSGLGYGFGIFVMHADGTDKTRLTEGSTDSSPIWSPNGQMILFDSDRSSGPSATWAMNADGSDIHFLVAGYRARWSPDGTKLIYTGQTPDMHYRIFVANADGSLPARLTADAWDEVRPAWSPDGTRVVFSAYPTGSDMNLYVVNADGRGEKQLTQTTGFSQDAVWSPDGKQIAFTHGAPNQFAAIHVVDADGSNDRTLTALGCGNASWSPDSRQIAYDCTTSAGGRVYRMNADGSEKHLLSTSSVNAITPSWKPVP